MAPRKNTKKEIVVKEIIKEITPDKVITLAKEKGCKEENLLLIQDWIRTNHGLYGELFYSLFHKKWSVNNYFINLTKGERISWNYTGANFDDYNDALSVILFNLLNLI